MWDDAVNTASRMEWHGAPGQIQITRETYELISDIFALKPFQQLEAMLAHKLQQRQMGLAFCPLTAYTYLA